MRGPIDAPFHGCRVDKMAPQVWDILQKYLVQTDADMVEQYQVLMNLPHIPNMGNDRNPEFLRQQAHRKKLADSGDPDGIHL